MLTKCKNEFSNGLSEAKKVIDKEIEEKQVLLGRLKNLEHEQDSNKAIFEEECWAMEDNKYNSMLQEGLNVEEMENEEKEMQLSR